MEPPSLVLDTTRLRPALDIDTDPVDRSGQQSTATLSLMSRGRREGQSAERAVGEKRLVKGTFPHVTPFASRRRLTRPRQSPVRRTLRPAKPGPIGSSSCPRERRRHPHPWPVAPPDAFSVGQRLVHRSTASLPKATVGSGGNHRHLPLQVLDPFHLLLCAPLPDTGSDSDIPDLLVSHQEG